MKSGTPLLLALLIAFPALADFPQDSHPLFTEDAVHEIHLTFPQEGWWDSLTVNFEDHIDDPLFMSCEFDWEGVHYDSIGVRFKGNSSYWSYYGEKKSFKLDLNEYIDNQNIEGIEKLYLNNAFKDPSFTREKCFAELGASIGMPMIRANYAALYINGEYWGLYDLIEGVNNEFIESRFGFSEDGNLFKGDPHGDLQWRGPNESDYYDHYELKSNEEENDWSQLVDLVNVLDNIPQSEIPDSLPSRLDLGSALGMLALNILTVNLDSYSGSGHNFYFYDRDSDGRFVFIPWDANEAWGCFSMGMPISQLKNLGPLWLSYPGHSRPLGFKLYGEPEYRELFFGYLRSMMDGYANPDSLVARMEELRDLVRPWVYADTKMVYTTAHFENAMSVDLTGGPGGGIPGLEPFIRDRHDHLLGILGSASAPADLVLNELMADNATTLADEFGGYDDWLEITNRGDAALNLAGMSLTDDLYSPDAFVFPDTSLAPGEYLLVWCDDESVQGPLHADFKLSADGECVYLLSDGEIVDETGFDPLAEDLSWGRWPDASGDWMILGAATPGAENENPEEPEEILLYINEFVALNNTGIQDEMGSYEDWLEIYNPGVEAIELGGLYLTDDLLQTTMWAIPDTSIAAGGFLVIWCDNDESDGPLHTNFKLSGGGEEVGLFGRVAAGNDLIDSYVFGAQSADVSEGRESDGGEPWVFFSEPTPGASNGSTAAGDTPALFSLGFNYPNPFNPSTTIRYQLPHAGEASLRVFDLQGRLVRDLLDGFQEAGDHSLLWDGRDEKGRAVGSGIYFSRLRFEGSQQSRKMLLMK
ncbi:MAG: CotH kinase family protein [Candidatus Krumholzibacteria bacterium]|nr:CotH kinase family protein [Candidatus Krumholzibacteria bacterium]